MKYKSILTQTRRPRVSRPYGLAMVSLFAVLLMVSSGFQAAAQADDTIWATAVNLSHSGAASRPIIIAQPDGSLRVFWWDRFDGVTMAETSSFTGSPAEWSDPLPTQIVVLEALERPAPDGSEFLAKPITAMPYIFGDALGQAHAVWLGEADQTTGARPLLHARLGETSTNWTTTRVLAESAIGFSATVDAEGSIHLVYMRALNTARLPSGVYYRRSDNGGVSWQAPAAVYLSRYLRLLSPEDTRLSVAADEADSVYVSWGDPQLQGVQLAASLDGGGTWQAPTPVGVPADEGEGRTQNGHAVSVSGGDTQFFWEVFRPSGVCELYQAPVQDVLSGGGELGRHVLPQWRACSPDKQFFASGAGRILLAAERSDGFVLLATWDGSLWQRSSPLAIQLEGPGRGGRVQLSTQRFALSQVLSAEGERSLQVLAIAGTDQNDEVWISGSRMEDLEPLLSPLMPTPTPTPRLRLPGTEEGQDLPAPQPSNLSRSGAVLSPSIVAGPEGRMRAFWWDAFDGLMVADGAVWATSVLSGTQAVSSTLDIWSDAVQTQISVPDTVLASPGEAQESDGPSGSTPISVMPRIVADAAGRSHAFWLQERSEEPGVELLLYSSLDGESIFWSPVVALTESAVAFDLSTAGDGSLHLVYLRSRHTGDAAAGLYHRRSDDGGATWSVPVAVDTSRYYRLLGPESSHLRLSADGVGGVHVTWDHPYLERLLLAASFDGGVTWSEPVTVGGSDAVPQRGRLFAMPVDGQSKTAVTWLLWEDSSFGGGCVLYQAPMHEILKDPEATGLRVLDELMTCPQTERFLTAGTDGVLMVVGEGSDVLTLIIWDGQQWSEPQRRSFRFENPTTGAPVYLGDLQSTLVQIPSKEGASDSEPLDAGAWTDEALVACGTDGRGDVWSVPSQMGTLEAVFAPPSPWSMPVNVSIGRTLPGSPAMAADAEGRVHALWSESDLPGSIEKTLRYARWDGESWARPATVLQSPAGAAEQLAMVVQGDFLHALWSGGSSPQVWHSRAFVQDASAAAGWSEPQSLPIPDSATGAGGATWPHVVASQGVLHAVYAVPVNENRGIYYVRSEDNGTSWQLAGQVFDAAEAGWTAADTPRLAVDARGSVHVVWVHNSLSPGKPPQGVFYAVSEDDGETWSEPLEVVEGAYAWPQVGASGTGQVHLVWNEAVGGAAWHRWAPSSSTAPAELGDGWTRAERVPGLSDVRGPMGLASDGAGRLHLVGLGLDDSGELALLYTVWSDAAELAAGDGRWAKREVFRLGLDPSEPGIGIALQPTLGRLDIIIGGQALEGEETVLKGLWYTGRAVPPAGAPLPTVVPTRPTETPLPTPTPEPLATATPDLAGGPPPLGSDSTGLPLPLLLGGGLAALIVVAVLGTRSLLARRAKARLLRNK